MRGDTTYVIGFLSSRDERQDQFRVGDRELAGVRPWFSVECRNCMCWCPIGLGGRPRLELRSFFRGLSARLDCFTAVLDPFCISYCSK